MCNYHCKDCENLVQCMSKINILMYDEEDEEDKDLKYMYCKSYTGIYSMVKHHCDMKRFNFTWKARKNVAS